MKKIYSILFFFCLTAVVWGQELLNQANQSYSREDYKKAAELYEKALQDEGISSDLYYNLGNAYYKDKQYAKAILNYERALLLHPGDNDIKYNLTMAQKATVDNIKVLPELFLVRWYNAFVPAFTADQWGNLTVILFIGFLIMAALFFHATSISLKKSWFTLGIIMLLVSVMTIFFALKQYHRMTDRDSGIIMTPSVVVRGAPDNSGTELFVIHEGLKVQVIGTLGDWYNVRLADGNEGWIAKTDLEKI